MKPSHISIAILLVSPLLVSSVWAQAPASGNQSAAAPTAGAGEVPRLIKFSGALLDTEGRPQAGPVGVTFALYGQQNGGAALWIETQNVKPDANGSYTVLLGASSANGVPAELFASGEARWLGIQVGQQPEHERILLVSVPYALKAGDAETLGGLPASAFVTMATAGNAANSAGGATAALTPAHTQSGTTKATSAPQPAAACNRVTSDGSAMVNSIALFTTACNVQGSLMSQATINGFPGINLAGNNAGLLLNGTGTHQVTVTSTTTGVSGRLGQDANGFFFTSDTNGKSVRFLTNNGTLNEWMRITSAGNVGIGTTAPAQKLSVAGMIESTTGGFKFPDSTVQTTASLGGSVTSVGSGLGLTGGPITGSGTLAIDPTVVPQLTASSNTFTGSITANSLTGSGTGLSNVNAAMLNGLASTAFATVGANFFTGNQNILGNVSVSGALSLPNTTAGGGAGVIALGGAPFLHNFGTFNTFVGRSAGNTSTSLTGCCNNGVGFAALNANTSGKENSAFGFSALSSNTTGDSNSAFGSQALLNNTADSNSAFGASALRANTTGGFNAAFGASALSSNTTGGSNSAFGELALSNNTTGFRNAAFGDAALLSNTTGIQNAAFGSSALVANTTGDSNSAFGLNALTFNMTGSQNSAFGAGALDTNTTGSNNSAFGVGALFLNTTGGFNSAFGVGALSNFHGGDGNIAIGASAGTNLLGGSSNIYIGNGGVGTGRIGSESNTIRIGDPAVQTATFIAGIRGVTTATADAIPVVIDSAGQLGTVSSSRRFKQDIRDMGDTTDTILRLHPVRFRYKAHGPEGPEQYGLVAEEVAEVAPDLVARNRDGEIETVFYDKVNAILLNEVQKQERLIGEQQGTIARQQAEIQELAARLAKLEALITPKP